MAGIYFIISNYVDLNVNHLTLEVYYNCSALSACFAGKGLLISSLVPVGTAGPKLAVMYHKQTVNIKPYGPHILPIFLSEPVRVYKPNLDRNFIGIENRGRTVIYQ